ncbi:protein adenylyltransferase SelO [Alteromonas sp. CYL-A6]|uniref:protein adenylyltransferase SelO n=1 Tax=Alteromonas nitratireducens TaxID=3390813 RepID=UPI0034A9BFE9
MELSRRFATSLPELGSQVTPTLLKNQNLVMVNHDHARELRCPDDWWQNNGITQLLGDPDSVLSGGAMAQKYGGHQFGYWNPDLGDGRGLLLGEAQHQDGTYHDLHLKGAGQTPYSRFADGRAVLRSTLREYIGSEAMHALGVPSSRSLCLFTSDETVLREQPESGAMMIRTAPSHIRFGHFEYFFHAKAPQKLNALMTYTLEHHFPECLSAANPPAALLNAITLRTARLIALWQSLGFVHGVMNTDNMSVHGITFDYGPYAFMDAFNASAVFNHSDEQGRYAFDQQPGVALWNLNMLAYAFTDHCSVDEIKAALSQFEPVFLQQYGHLMRRRLGLNDTPQSQALIDRWLSMLSSQQRDYTHSFRLLARSDLTDTTSFVRDHFLDRDAFDAWWHDYRALRLDSDVPQSALLTTNPAVIPRTHLLADAIAQAETGDFVLADTLFRAVTSPYDSQWDAHPFAAVPTGTHEVSLSCSS